MNNILRKLFAWPIILIACATIGLAPFTPEPHIWADLRWLVGGANGMELINWLDLLFHGVPWVALISKVLIAIRHKAFK